MRQLTPVIAAALGSWSLLALGAAEPADSTEFFEKRIRPVLSDACYKCHSSTSEKLKGGLMLDSREAALKGGDTGPALAPGDLDKSLLIEAIRWQNQDLQMPPKKALPAGQIADIEAWIKAGAPWPQEAGAKVAAKKVFDLQQRKREHWCWQPVRDTQAPAVKAADWPQNDVDRFILAKLEAKDLRPAPDADARTLVRRLSFDLTGLPPSPEQVENFVHEFGEKVSDAEHPVTPSPPHLVSTRSTPQQQALEHLVDSLLASPHFGERWARHWLDLVRYAETRGHEFDPEIPNAWQYRDYVVRALNDDVPYNRFAAEHIAGDLLAPRIDPKTGANESIVGTGFWFLGEEVHSPVDIRQDEADRMDNRLDVMGKAFLGLTIGCARCHDHKFDAISQRDYYAMQGFLVSSSYRQARFETLETDRRLAQELDDVRAAGRAGVLNAVADALDPGVARTADLLMAAREVLRDPTATPIPDEGAGDSVLVDAMVAELKSAKGDPHHPLHTFATLPGADGAVGAIPPGLGISNAASPASFTPEQIVADYTRANATPWIQDGVSFGLHPLRAGDAIFGSSADQPLLGLATRGAAVRDPVWKVITTKGGERDYGTLAKWERSGQSLRTPEITLAAERLWYLVKGAGRAYAVVNSHLMVKGPLHGAVLKEWSSTADRWQWVEQPLAAYVGHRLHVEFSPMGRGDLAIAMVVQAREKPPLPDTTAPQLRAVGKGATPHSPRALAEAAQTLLADACASLRADPLPAANVELADWLVRKLDLFAPPGSPSRRHLATSTEAFFAAQSSVTTRIRPASQTAPAMFDGSGADEFVLVRGQAKNPAALVPRGFLEAIAGPDQPAIESGSGRAQLAQRIIDPANPLTARVIVNRVWHHLFGRGIVPTVDNFGVLGQPPSHPELLDHLASGFVTEQGWSLKQLIRELVLSRTYQMSSQPADGAAEQSDPDNLLLHRMNVRRLEGEAIRDAILTVSGRLDPRLGGPSVPVHLTEFMDGRGRPRASGPLDGDGRRSIYTAVRRNFLPPMMLAFDTPIPFNAMGRRNVSNVPAQALILMNDPFVVGQAKVWAHRLPAGVGEAARVRQMYLAAFSRPPNDDELADAAVFLREQRSLYATTDPTDERTWADFAHVLFNVKEFIYLN